VCILLEFPQKSQAIPIMDPLSCFMIKRVSTVFYTYIFHFAWEDQSDSAYCIFHTVLISCITVLYEPHRTVMHLIGQIQYSYAENLFAECYVNASVNNTSKSLKPAKLAL